MSNNTAETTATPGLKEKVQALRDKAREILRARMISDILQDIFYHEKTLVAITKEVEATKKEVARANYALDTLDDTDPDYEDKKAKADKRVESANKTLDSVVKNADADTTATTTAIEKANAKIADIEEGKVKVSIDEVKALADKMIETSL